MKNARRLALLAACAFIAACDPTIKKFDVKPGTVQCGANVTIEWEGTGDGVHLKASQPVLPALPADLPKAGTRQEAVFKTTEFTLYYPGAGHREKTVTVTGTCPGPGPGPGTCGPQVLTFTGTCFSAAQGPTYISVPLSTGVAPGKLTALSTDADFPVHVQHLGETIPLAPGGGPLFPPLPDVAAAGDYTITVPGQAGQNICAQSGPTSGTTEAPVVHVTVTPTCPQP